MKKILLKNNNGFTLVEVLVALSILVLFAVAFVPLFSNSVTNIFTYGTRDRTMAEASEYLEILYARSPYATINDVVADLNALEGNDILANSVNLGDHDPTKSFNFIVDTHEPVPGVSGFQVTIAVFYHNGDRYVAVSSFIREE